ncbi:MAG: alkaline phosphatase, partial [Candidatus Carbobacillus altaicus]|nr:alkaline phosphatase [Candidatus Carbobacillus altaicus]
HQYAGGSIILFIADGLSPQLFQLADTYHTLRTGKHLTLQQSMEPLGLTFTTAWQDEITDSAAAATALFSGTRTMNGMINMSAKKQPLKTITEAAKEQGFLIGIVTTTHITHATPAGAYAHTYERDREDLIAEQLLQFQPDVALGGGRQFFLPFTSTESARLDNIDLIQQFSNAGYHVIWNREQLWQRMMYDLNRKKLLGLFQVGHMSFEIDRLRMRPEIEPSLAEMTKTALVVLDDLRKDLELHQQGPELRSFFLVVEGGRIDHLAHAHDTRAAIEEVIAFDQAVSVALDYQKSHPDTLIIVTSDHDTGGLIWEGRVEDLALHHLDNIEISLDWLNFLVQEMLKRKKHGGFYETTAAFLQHALEDRWGLFLSEAEQKALTRELAGDAIDRLKNALSSSPTLDQTAFQYVLDLANGLVTTALNKRIGLNWTTTGHTAGAVITWAKGPGTSAEIFRGVYHLTDIPRKIARVAQIDISW